MNMSIPVYLMIPLVLLGCESNNTELNPSENTELNIQTDNGLCPSSQSIAREAIAIVNLLRATGRECSTEFLPAADPLAWNELLEQVAKYSGFQIGNIIKSPIDGLTLYHSQKR